MATDNPGALKSAAAEGKLDQIKELIEKQNVDVNQPDEFGDTALHAASQNAREDIVRYLLEKGANANARNKTGSTPLHKLVASRFEQKNTLKKLIAAGADPSIRNNAGILPEQLVRNKTILLELLKDEAITEDVDVPKANHGRVIGKGGQKMTEIRDETHCIISVPGQSDKSSLISITGRKEGVARAKVLIQEAVAGPKKDEEGGDTHHAVSVKYPLAKDLHKFVIGKNGRTINEIRDETGVQIIVPKGDDADAAIVLKGDQEGIDQAIKRIREVTIASKPNNGSPRVGGGRGGSNGERRGSRDNNNNNGPRRGSGQGGERRDGRRGSGQGRGESSEKKANTNEDGTPRIQFMQPGTMSWGDFVEKSGGAPKDTRPRRERRPREDREAPAEGTESPAPSNEAEK